ncbi:alpha/beta fold hydrolase [Myxococcota bacterium]|nr:alpha/beta fold hydrolase [Myxococcota bacterium]
MTTNRSSAPLRSLQLTAPGAQPTRWALVLHGILGSGTNLRTFARRLALALPDWGFVLPDLRGHGDSPSGEPPHTVAACAQDTLALTEALGITPRAILGHSFGGKVALAFAQLAEAEGAPLDRVWVLDAPPGRPDQSLAVSSEVAQVVFALRGLPARFERREELVTLLTAQGFSASLAQWMTTNLRSTGAGLTWRFDLDVIEALLHDYAATDAWTYLDDPRRHARVDVVRAERSERWSEAELARFAAAPSSLRLHLLPDAGHWVHVDNPDGLLAMIQREGLDGSR